jgi:hypothetical protein
MESNDEIETIYTLSDPIKAEIIKNALEEEGIRCFLDGMNEMIGPGVGAFRIHVQVPVDDVERATAFVKEHEAAHGSETEIDEDAS